MLRHGEVPAVRCVPLRAVPSPETMQRLGLGGERRPVPFAVDTTQSQGTVEVP